MRKYKLKKTIIGSEAGTIFKYGETKGAWESVGAKLVEGTSLGNVCDLIKAIGINNKEYFEEIKEYDFSEFIYKSYRSVSIKSGNMRLTGNSKGEIMFTEMPHHGKQHEIEYTETTIGELSVGDVFVRKGMGNYISDFKIFIGLDGEGDSNFQYIKNISVLLAVSSNYFEDANTKVIKIS